MAAVSGLELGTGTPSPDSSQREQSWLSNRPFGRSDLSYCFEFYLGQLLRVWRHTCHGSLIWIPVNRDIVVLILTTC